MAHATRRSLAKGAVAALFGTAAVVGGTTNDPDPRHRHPDAILIALCREYVEKSHHQADLCAKQDALPNPQTADHAEWNRLDDIACGLSVRIAQLEDKIPELAALTPAGQRAKAEALLELMRPISPQHGGPFAQSLALDLIGRA